MITIEDFRLSTVLLGSLWGSPLLASDNVRIRAKVLELYRERKTID